MNETLLRDMINEWKEFPRNNMEELAIADEYFDNQLMPLSRDIFLETQQDKAKGNYYGMILTLGTSWQPLALSISLLKPQKLLIMCTQDTVAQLDKLKAFLKLDDEAYSIAIVDRGTSDDIFKAMRAFYGAYGSNGRFCIDITGGTKAMSSSAAIMAAVLGLDIYYVESKYLPLYRRPEPGSEELKALGNPQKS